MVRLFMQDSGGGVPLRPGYSDNRNGAKTRDRTGDLQIFGLTLSQLSYLGDVQLRGYSIDPPANRQV